MATTPAAALSFSTLATLANGSFASATALTSGNMRDFLVEVTPTVGTVAGNKQYLVYVGSSVDGTNFSDATLEANMRLLGIVSTTANATAYRSQAMSVAAAYGGELPPAVVIIVKNDSGVAFTAGTGQYVGVY